MNNKQAKAEINQIYGMVSSDIQRALDIALEAIDLSPDKDLFNLYIRFFSKESKEIRNFLQGVSSSIPDKDRCKYIDEWIDIIAIFEQRTKNYKRSTEKRDSEDNKTI